MDFPNYPFNFTNGYLSKESHKHYIMLNSVTFEKILEP